MAPVIMWITAPSRAVLALSWKSLPLIASCIEVIIESCGAHRDAMWCRGVKKPVPSTHAAPIAYIAITNDATTPATAPWTNARPALGVPVVLTALLMEASWLSVPTPAGRAQAPSLDPSTGRLP